MGNVWLDRGEKKEARKIDESQLQDIKAFRNPDAEGQLCELLATEIAKEIDAEVMKDLKAVADKGLCPKQDNLPEINLMLKADDVVRDNRKLKATWSMDEKEDLLLGFKGKAYMDSGYFFAPYMPMQDSPTITLDEIKNRQFTIVPKKTGNFWLDR